MARKSRRGSDKRPGAQRYNSGPRRNSYPLEIKLRAVEEVLDRGTPASAVARAFGIGVTTLKGWVTQYQEGGSEALLPKPLNPLTRTRRASDTIKRNAIEELRRAASGTRDTTHSRSARPLRRPRRFRIRSPAHSA